MQNGITHIDKDVLVSFAKEAYSNIGYSLFKIYQKCLNSEIANNTDLISTPLFINYNQLLPEQKMDLQEMLIQVFPSVKIVLDYKVALLTRRTNTIRASYPFSEFISVLKIFIIAIDSICNGHLESIDLTVINYLKYIIESAPNTIRNSYKYDRYKEMPSLLPERGLNFIFESKFLRNKKDNKKTLNPKWIFSPGTILNDNNKGISNMGIVELISLFLPSDRIYNFLISSKVFKYYNFRSVAKLPNLTEQQIVHSILSCYSIRIPKSSPNIIRGSFENAIEIIHYLRKCPDELYPVLPTDKQAEFVMFDNLNRKVFMKRSTDSFPNLAIEYFDSNNCFKNLRFGIHLGYQSKKKHRSIYADGRERERYVKYNINCFSSISDAYGVLSSLKEKLSDIHEDKVSFIRNGDNFALSIGNKIPFIQDGRIRCAQPDCWISKYDLEAMAFYEYLCPGDAERIIIEEIKRYKETAFKKKGLWNSTHKREILRNETETLLKDFAKKKKIILGGNTKYGSKRYCRIYSKIFADFLIKDIVFWIDSNTYSKPTGLQYAVIKGMLSNYDGIQYKMEDISKAINNICGNQDKHVILRNMGETNNIIDFYEKYLHNRQKFLSDSQSAKFLQSTFHNSKEVNEHNNPILLPRHIFYLPILHALVRFNDPSIKTIIDKTNYDNINSLNYIVKAFFEIIIKDKSQKMYLCHRRDQYGLFRLLANNPGFENIVHLSDEEHKTICRMRIEEQRYKLRTISNAKSFLEEFSLAKKHVATSERAIRRHRINDMILFLLSQRQLSNEIQNLRLEAITPNGESLHHIITQKVIARIEDISITINYTSTIKDGYLLFRWLSDSMLQKYLIDNKNADDSVSITSEELLNMYNCRLHY